MNVEDIDEEHHPKPEEQDPPKVFHPFSPHILSLLLPASMFGVLARLGLQALATYDGHSIFPLAYPQAVGCLVMGLCREGLSGYTPLFIALTTGFCGSLTTFSGWQLDVFQSWLNAQNNHRGSFRDVIDGLTKSVFTPSISLASLFFGRYLGKYAKVFVPHPSRTASFSVAGLSVLLYAAAFPLYFCLSPSYRHQATSALLFSVPGTLTRYAISVKINTIGRIPWGTFTINVGGTALLGVFYVLQRLDVNSTACTTLQGLADGYCGCLTTISTYAVEISILSGKKKWAYPLGSWIVGQLLLLLIIGTALLSGVKKDRLCAFEK